MMFYPEAHSSYTGPKTASNPVLIRKFYDINLLRYFFYVSGNGCIIVTKEKNSDEKVNTITLLGAEVIQIKNNEDEEETAAKLIAADPKNRMTLAQVRTEFYLVSFFLFHN